MTDSITICITCYNDTEFIINTLYCLEKITKNPYKVIIRDNNSIIKNFIKLKKNIQKYPDVELYRVENFKEYGSIAHGISLNDLVNKIDTKYGVILDADCTFLLKDWDEILINNINEEYPIIGTQIDPHTDTNKPLDFPSIVGILFYTQIIKELNIDFSPNYDDPENFMDTAYQLKEKYIENGYKGKIINCINTRYTKYGPFRKILSGEYYLNGYKDIFAAHYGRGASLGKGKYLKGWKKRIYLIPIIGSYLLTLKGKRDKKKWIKICKKIVNAYNHEN